MNQSTGVDPNQMTIAVLGGTGPQGRGLSFRFAQAGLAVVIGSRLRKRAAVTAVELAELSGGSVTGATNADAARAGDVVLVSVPWDGHGQLLHELAPELADKVVIDCVNPLGFDRHGAYPISLEEGSATQQAAAILKRSRVVGAFHHVSAVLLENPDIASVDTDVMVVGDDREATDLVQALIDLLPGMRGLYAGRLRNASQVEALTANLISMNRRYRAHAGVRITDV